jgi:4-hydroxybenzoate polyprenyltransferase
MHLFDLMQLGRVSNLPTVWSNVLAAVALSGATMGDLRLPIMLLAMSLMYVGGMALNDACDAHYDTLHRPERPIPSGRLAREWVFVMGFGFLFVGALLIFFVGVLNSFSLEAGLGALTLMLTILWYDWSHKENNSSPLLMGIARFLVYICVALSYQGSITTPLLLAGLALMSYIIGLTYIARQENLRRIKQIWPIVFLLMTSCYLIWANNGGFLAWLLWLAWNIWVFSALILLINPESEEITRSVARLIAGISLLDAAIITATGRPDMVVFVLLCFVATLTLQRWITAS